MRRLRLPLVPRWLRLGGVGVVAATILYFSVFTPPGSGVIRNGPFGVFPYSTWLHAMAYFGLAVVLAYAFEDRPWRGRTVLAVVFLVAVGYGGGIELLQSTLDARTADFGDLLVNAAGTAFAAVCWRVATRQVRFYRARQVRDLEPLVR